METGTSKVAIDSQIFRCDNLSLAIALSAMGCKFAQSDGRTLAGLNQYTLAFIRGQLDPKTGEPRAKGMTHEDAIRLLWRQGIPGNVIYFFERCEVLTAFCAGWDEQGQTGVMDEVPIAAEAKDAGRIARRLAQTRAEFIGDKSTTALWRRRDEDGNLFIPAIAHAVGTSSTEATGDSATRITIRGASLRAVKI